MQLSLNCALSYLLTWLCFNLFTWRMSTLRTGWCTVLCKRNESGCRRNLRISANKLWTFLSYVNTKKRLNLDASIVRTSTKFRKLDDEPKRNFAAWDKFRLFVWSNRNEIPFSQGVHVCAILINFLWFIKKKKKIPTIATIVVEIENLRQNGAFYNWNSIFFVFNIILFYLEDDYMATGWDFSPGSLKEILLKWKWRLHEEGFSPGWKSYPGFWNQASIFSPSKRPGKIRKKSMYWKQNVSPGWKGNVSKRNEVIYFSALLKFVM